MIAAAIIADGGKAPNLLAAGRAIFLPDNMLDSLPKPMVQPLSDLLNNHLGDELRGY